MLTPPERDYPISQRGAWVTETPLWHWRSASRLRCSSAAKPALARWSMCRCWPLRCGHCPPTCWRCSTAVRSAPMSGRGPQVNPLVGNYRTKDGRHIQLMFLQGDRYWVEFCRVVGRDDLIDDPRFVDLAARRANS